MYMGKPYSPWWLDNLADDVTGEGAAIQGALQGAEQVRTLVLAARALYEHQELSFIGDYGDNGFLELYTCEIHGEPTRVVVTVTRNAAGKAQRIVVNHRPRSSVLLFARLMGEKFAGTPLAKYFIGEELRGESRPGGLPREGARELPTVEVQVRRLSVVSSRPFDEVVSSLTATIGRPDMQTFPKALHAAASVAQLEKLVQAAIGSSGLMEFARFDAGEVLRKEGGGRGPRILRLLVGNPLIMKEMARTVPDAASYAPVTILIDERSDGVHLSYDSMASLLAPYGSQAALGVARELDAKIEQLLETAARWEDPRVDTSSPSPGNSGALHELGLAAAARAIRDGEISPEDLAGKLLERARAHADLNAFITIDEVSVLEAARQADRSRRAGRSAPLLGVPLAVKDSYLTKGLTTTFGTSVLASFKPTRDAVAVAALKDAGAIIFGKNNLVEMSYGLTGHNAHHGQARNPYNKAHVTGGSSSGAGASVAARIVPAALGGDTVGSIRVPASLCGVVGYKPTPGRWPAQGVAPISETLDTTGLLGRSVEDCELVDAILTRAPLGDAAAARDLKGVQLAYAPRQHLADVDAQTEAAFRETLRRLEGAGARLIEIDLGDDFLALTERTTWPIFLHETMPAVREFLASNEVPVSFEQILAGLGEHLHASWSHAVVPSGAGYVPDEQYLTALSSGRQELRRRLEAIAFGRADALIFPTTPCAAPRIENQWSFRVGGKDVTDLFLARNTHPSSSAGVPGISLPMALSSEGLPLGLELDAAPGRDRDLLALARRVERVLGPVPGPAGFLVTGERAPGPHAHSSR